MANLRFNPYYALAAYSTADNGPTFPLKENDLVSMTLVFGTTIEITPTRQTDEDLHSIRAKLEGQFWPSGRDMREFMLSEIVELNNSRVHWLRFHYSLTNMLEAILMTDEPETDFPIRVGQRIRMPLIVSRIHQISPAYPTGESWYGLLAPWGTLDNGLILTDVNVSAGT